MKDIPPTPPPKEVPRPSIHLNIKDWLPFLEDEDIPEARKVELIQILWSIVLSFVDQKWTYSASSETSGQGFDLTNALRQSMLNSNDQQKEEV